MSDTQDNEIQTTPQDELVALKARADMMGISYHPSIGLEKLREKVNAALQDPTDEAKPEAPVSAGAESKAQRMSRLKREAAKLVRIRVTCMNPAKKEWEGEIFSVGNSTVGSFTKYVPFNTDEGWHVPHMIYQMIVDRQCQVFQTISDSRGNKTRKGKLIKEFSVEVLPPLTPEELHDLAQRQAMSNSID
jgi:hypothetical protein